MKKGKGTVFVGLSGGVDSSVSALRLLHAGYTVHGVFIKTWSPDFLSCSIEDDRLDAMRVAATLNIPFHTFDAEDAYRDEVGMYLVEEYKAGRVPNPDVMCNKYVKFGAFYEYARAHGADYIATGHYAQVRDTDGKYTLIRGKDSGKDQSYFLWTLSEEILAHTLFPVGDSKKEDVRKEAELGGLPTATKKDSQGICFLGPVDMKEFLGNFVTLKEGVVLRDDGTPIGTHDGAILYTIGQRAGFRVHTESSESVPHYVIKKNIEANTITVSTVPPTLKTGKTVHLDQVHIRGEVPETLEVQFRYRQHPYTGVLTLCGAERGMLKIEGEHTELPSIGQSAVFYRGDECLGGAIVQRIEM